MGDPGDGIIMTLIGFSGSHLSAAVKASLLSTNCNDLIAAGVSTLGESNAGSPGRISNKGFSSAVVIFMYGQIQLMSPKSFWKSFSVCK